MTYEEALSTAPEGAVFLGFGGTAEEYETFVFFYKGDEYRFPSHPEAWIGPFKSVGYHYGVPDVDDWQDVLDMLEDRE